MGFGEAGNNVGFYRYVEPMASSRRPDTALLLCIIGGVFTILQGAAYVLGGLSCISNGPGPVNPALCHSVVAVGAIGIAGGVVMFACGAALSRWSQHHVLIGGVAVSGAAIGLPALLIVGGGSVPFFLGPLLGVVGGFLAVAWQPGLSTGSGPGQPYPPV